MNDLMNNSTNHWATMLAKEDEMCCKSTVIEMIENCWQRNFNFTIKCCDDDGSKDDANNSLQAIANMFDNLEPKKQL